MKETTAQVYVFQHFLKEFWPKVNTNNKSSFFKIV